MTIPINPHGNTAPQTSPQPDSHLLAQAPESKRLRSASFNIQVFVGIFLIALAGGLGAYYLGSFDKSVEVWKLKREVAAHYTILKSDVEITQVRSSDGLSPYLFKNSSPVGKVTNRALGDGELVPKEALEDSVKGSILTFTTSQQTLPPMLSVGQSIDVYLYTKQGPGDKKDTAIDVHRSIPVLNIKKTGASSSTTGTSVSITVRLTDDPSVFVSQLSEANRVYVTISEGSSEDKKAASGINAQNDTPEATDSANSSKSDETSEPPQVETDTGSSDEESTNGSTRSSNEPDSNDGYSGTNTISPTP